MQLNTTAHGLLLAGLLAAAALNGGCDDDNDSDTTGTTGATGTTEMPTIPTDCTTDTETGTATFTLTHLGVAETDGFDIDSINNAPAPAGMGATVSGCGKTDLSGGRDNGLAAVAAGLNAALSLDNALQSALVQPAGDGGTTGSLTATITLSHLAADHAPNDASLCATMTLAKNGATGSSTMMYTANGAMVNNTVFLDFVTDPVFDIELALAAGLCNAGGCNPAVLEIPLREARARLALNADHTSLLAGSLLGGFVFYVDMTDGYTAVNATGFGAALMSFATASNSSMMVASSAQQAFGGGLDLHMNPDGTLAPCMGANNSSVNKNAFSAGLSIDSVAP